MLRISDSIEFRVLEKNILAPKTLQEERVPLTRSSFIKGAKNRTSWLIKKATTGNITKGKKRRQPAPLATRTVAGPFAREG